MSSPFIQLLFTWDRRQHTPSYPLNILIFTRTFIFGSLLLGENKETGPTLVYPAFAGGVVDPLVLGHLIGLLSGLTSFLLLTAHGLVITPLGSLILRKHSFALRPSSATRRRNNNGEIYVGSDKYY